MNPLQMMKKNKKIYKNLKQNRKKSYVMIIKFSPCIQNYHLKNSNKFSKKMKILEL